MITCDNCEHRRNFNIVSSKKTTNANMCMEDFVYVNLGTVYVDCPMNIDEHKAQIKKQKKAERRMKWVEAIAVFIGSYIAIWLVILVEVVVVASFFWVYEGEWPDINGSFSDVQVQAAHGVILLISFVLFIGVIIQKDESSEKRKFINF